MTPSLRVRDRHRPAITLAIAVVLFVHFGVWALIRPPGQSPDEAHHLAKLLSLPGQPWVASALHVTVSGHHASPFARDDLPPALAKLPFNPDARLSLEEISSLKAIGAPAPDAPALLRTQAAGYPTPGYWALWGVGRGALAVVRRVVHVTPYQEFFVWRLAAAFVAALLWAALLHQARRPAAVPSPAALTLVLMGPMTAMVCSSIGPDAIHLPLALLTLAMCARAIAIGGGVPVVFALAVATALVSPRGLLVAPALLVAVAMVAVLGPGRRHVAPRLCVALAVASLVAWLAFYRVGTATVYGEGSSSVGNFLLEVGLRLPALWRQLWGKMGWLDYALPAWYYVGLTVLLLANLATRRRASAREAHTPAHAATLVYAFALAYAAAIVGAMWWQLPDAATLLQGRYFLPCIAALGLWLDHDRRPLRMALLAWLVAMNVAFIPATVERYYADGWAGLWAALPF